MKITKTYELVPIAKLVSYAPNAREHNAKQMAHERFVGVHHEPPGTLAGEGDI